MSARPARNTRAAPAPSARRSDMRAAAPLRERSSQGALGEGIRGPHGAPHAPKALTAAKLLTAGQLAQRWQVPVAHVYRLTRRGDVPAVRLGRYCRYRLDAIEAWEEAQANA